MRRRLLNIQDFTFAEEIRGQFQAVTLTLFANLDKVERGLYSAPLIVFDSGTRAS